MPKFKKGYSPSIETRQKLSLAKLGSRNSQWRGGKKGHSQGYVRILSHGHPFADSKGYILEHRYVWEQSNNAILLPWSNIHHINGIRTDNRIENLEAIMNYEHPRLHLIKDMTNRKCIRCGTSKTYIIKGGFTRWLKHPITKEGFVCGNCYNWIKRHE